MPTRIEIDRLQELLAAGDTQLVEVLPRTSYDKLHLRGAESIPLKQLDADSTAGLDKTKPVVVYCYDYL